MTGPLETRPSLVRQSLRFAGVVLALIAASCTETDRTLPGREGNAIVLLNPQLELGEHWQHRRLRRGKTTYTRVESELGHTLRAQGNESASILFRIFDPIALDCDRLSWSWYVDKPQPGADLRIKGKDDVAASIFVMFGDAGIFNDKPVPTLKYVWANEQHKQGDIIVGPYLKKYLRTLIVRTGSAVDLRLVMERANLSEDYYRAFGEPLRGGIYGIAIFTDNDDTREPVVAHYGKIELLCDE